MVPNAQGWLLGHPAPSGQMQGMWSACLGAKNHVPGLTCHQASHHHMVTPLHPGLVPLGNKKAITYIPAWPGLSLSEALRLHRHPLGLLCYDCDQTRHLNLMLLDTCHRYLPKILRYHAHWTDDIFPGVTDLHLCQFFSTRPGFDDSPSCVRFCVCSKSRPRAKFPEVTLGVCGNHRFRGSCAWCHTVS